MDIWDILSCGAAVTVVGLLIWLVKLIFHDKLDARWHYFIWLVLLVRMLVPADFAWVRTPVSVLQAVPVLRWVKMIRLTAQDLGPEQLPRWLFVGYLAGAGLLGGYYLVVWLIMKLQVWRARRASEEMTRYVEAIAVRYGLKPCRDIRIMPCATPYICGLIRPVLVLPRDFRRSEEAVILHELLHRKHGDVAVNLLLHVVRVLNWYNPFLWLVTSVIQNDGEALCDERVLELLVGKGDQEGEGRSGGTEAIEATEERSSTAEAVACGYGRMLLGEVSGKHKNHGRIGTSNLAGTYWHMRIRLLRIRDFDRVPKKIGIVTFCITLLLALSRIGSAGDQESVLAFGGGTGYVTGGQCWEPGDEMEIYVQILVDGVVVEEGEGWNENH